MAERWVEHDVGAGVRWLWNQLPDERDTLVVGLAREWLEADPAGATPWLEEVGISTTGTPATQPDNASNPGRD